MGRMGRGRQIGGWSHNSGGNDTGQSTGGRFEPGHYRGGRGFPNVGARGPRDGRGVGRPIMNMDPLGRGRGGGGRHDFYEPPHTNLRPPHPPLIGFSHSKERPRGAMDGRFADGPRDGGSGIAGGSRVPFRGRGRMFRGGGGRLDGAANSSRAPPIRDLNYFGPGFRPLNNRGGGPPGPTLGPERYGPMGSNMSVSSSSSAHPKDDSMSSSKFDAKHLDGMGRPGEDRSESSFHKRSLPTYSSMSEIVEEGKDTSRYVDTDVHHGGVDDIAASGPLPESSFVPKKTKYEPSESMNTNDYNNSEPAENHDNHHKNESSRVTNAYDIKSHEDKDRMETSGSFDPLTNSNGSNPTQIPRHIPFDSSSGRGGYPRRGGMFRGGGSGRMSSFARGRGSSSSGGRYPYNQPYQQPNPSDASIARSDSYGQENKDYHLSRNVHGDSGRSNVGPGMGMGRGLGNQSTFSSPSPPFHRGAGGGGGGGERPYGMGSRGRWGARNVGRHYPMDGHHSGPFAGRGDRVSGGRGFSTHRSSTDHHYNSRPSFHDVENQYDHFTSTTSLSEEREQNHYYSHQSGYDNAHHYQPERRQTQQVQEQQQQQEQLQQQQQEKNTQHDDKIIDSITSPEKFVSNRTPTPTKQIEEPIDVVPPSPPPGPPSALALARARLSDLNETMEFHYARHLQITKEHEIIKVKVETLKQLSIGMEAFQDDLDVTLLHEEQSV